MTEVVVGGTQEQADTVVASAGQLLRQARERQQMSVQALAAALKVPEHKLQALEEDRWELLTDSVFARALALSVCRFLHLDSAAVLAGLPKYEAARLSTNPEGINTPFKEKTLRSSMSSATQEGGNGRALKMLAVLLMVAAGAAGLYFVPHWKDGDAVAASTTSVVLVGEGSLTPAEPMFMPQILTPEASPVAQAATEAPSVAPAAVAVEASTPVPLRIVATGETWVQVRNAQQQVVMERILKAGDVYNETRTGQPLHVVVGKASAAQVEVHGAALNLANLAKNNVARFEVK